jgi:hypothetical protein
MMGAERKTRARRAACSCLVLLVSNDLLSPASIAR